MIAHTNLSISIYLFLGIAPLWLGHFYETYIGNVINTIETTIVIVCNITAWDGMIYYIN